jgi:hypothetical protein
MAYDTPARRLSGEFDMTGSDWHGRNRFLTAAPAHGKPGNQKPARSATHWRLAFSEIPAIFRRRCPATL